MAGLEDIDASNPHGSESPTQGDNRIRELASKLLESFGVEHHLAGEHSFSVGSLGERPSAGHEGRFYIQTSGVVETELYYDDGADWIQLTSNQSLADLLDAMGGGGGDLLSIHKAANPIDHPSNSVRYNHIEAGAIVKKHLDGSLDVDPIAELVDGSDITDTFHSHSQYEASSTIPDGSIAPIKMTDTIVGDVIIGSAPTTVLVTETSYAKIKEIKILRPGNIRVRWAVEIPIGGTVYTQVYKNGFPQGSEHSSSVDAIFYEDISAVENDLIQLYAKKTGSDNNYIKDFNICCDWACETLLDS